MIFAQNCQKCKWSTPKPSIILEEKTGWAQVAPKAPKRALLAQNSDFDSQRQKMCSTSTLLSTGRFWAKWWQLFLQLCREFRHGRKCSNSIFVCKMIKIIQDGIRNSQNCVVAKNKLTNVMILHLPANHCFTNVILMDFYSLCAQMRFLSDFPFLSPKVQKMKLLHFLAPGAPFSQNFDFLTKSATSRMHELTYP